MVKRQWYEVFFPGLYEQVLGAERFKQAAGRDARVIRRALALRKGQTVLDCPCGLGRIAFQLARAGMKVTGVDLTASYIRKASRRAKRLRLPVRLLRGDMRNLPFVSQFDAVVNWFSSFGYFDDVGNLAAAKAAFAALKPGGRFLFEGMNKSWLVSHFRGGHDEVINGVRIVNRSRWHARTNRVHDTWTMSRGRQKERWTFTLRIYNGAEMRSLLRQAGFADVRLFGHKRGKLVPFSRHCPRFIAVARKGF